MIDLRTVVVEGDAISVYGDASSHTQFYYVPRVAGVERDPSGAPIIVRRQMRWTTTPSHGISAYSMLLRSDVPGQELQAVRDELCARVGCLVKLNAAPAWGVGIAPEEGDGARLLGARARLHRAVDDVVEVTVSVSWVCDDGFVKTLDSPQGWRGQLLFWITGRCNPFVLNVKADLNLVRRRFLELLGEHEHLSWDELLPECEELVRCGVIKSTAIPTCTPASDVGRAVTRTIINRLCRSRSPLYRSTRLPAMWDAAYTVKAEAIEIPADEWTHVEYGYETRAVPSSYIVSGKHRDEIAGTAESVEAEATVQLAASPAGIQLRAGTKGRGDSEVSDRQSDLPRCRPGRDLNEGQMGDCVENKESPLRDVPICVVCGGDDAFAPGIAAMLHSLKAHIRGGQLVQVVILDGGMSARNKTRLEEVAGWLSHGIEVCWLIPKFDKYRPLRLLRWMTAAVYMRLSIAELLPSAVTRAIYLDGDVIVRSDITELWNEELGAHALLAVQNPWPSTVGAAGGIREFRSLGFNARDPYFNSGVMVINVKHWRENSFEARCIQYLKAHGDVQNFHDQEALNVVARGMWKRLDATWNVPRSLLSIEQWPESAFKAHLLERQWELLHDPKIVHFTGTPKPWQQGFRHPLADEAWDHLRQSGWGEL